MLQMKRQYSVFLLLVDGTGKIGINTTVAQMSSLATDIVMVDASTFVGGTTMEVYKFWLDC